MKKIVQTADLGGAPFYKSDFATVFNDEIWDAVEALLAPFSSDTEGIIVSGCVTTNNAGNFDITAGIVYLNGTFMRLAAATNQTYSKYIAPASVVNDGRTFADGSSHTVFTTEVAQLQGSAPGSGQYIAITSLTDADERRLSNRITTITKVQNTGPKLKYKYFAVSWNMDTTDNITIAHGMSATELQKIINATCQIYSNANDVPDDLCGGEGGGGTPFTFVRGNIGWNSTNIVLARRIGGYFDNASWNAATGHLIVWYME
jgi:hypothetical protein